jgi:hypothetical protein
VYLHHIVNQDQIQIKKQCSVQKANYPNIQDKKCVSGLNLIAGMYTHRLPFCKIGGGQTQAKSHSSHDGVSQCGHLRHVG